MFEYGRALLEALLFAAPEPLPPRRLAEIIGLEERAARDLCEDLKREYERQGRGLQVVEVAGGYQFVTRPDLAAYVAKLHPTRGGGNLTQAALETLAVVAYRQPVTRAEVEVIRGVNVDHSLHTLLERGLIREIGRKEGPGRPILYGTTREFLQHFGLKDLEALPGLPPPAEGVGAAPEGQGQG